MATHHPAGAAAPRQNLPTATEEGGGAGRTLRRQQAAVAVTSNTPR